jgi:hypothetical protein
MDDETFHERMATYEQLSQEIREQTRERERLADQIGTDLAGTISTAVSVAGANVKAVDRAEDGQRYRFEARLDRAALVAAVTEQLPEGFVVSHVNEDGTLSVEWTGERETPSKREHGALLKAIVAEEMAVDSDGLVETVPTRARVVSRAVELGIGERDATARLDRLATLNVVDLVGGEVYPGENFSRL